MNVDLSRRVARLKMFKPIRDLPPPARRAFLGAIEVATGFDHLAPEFQDLIRSAEISRERFIAERQRSVAESAPTA